MPALPLIQDVERYTPCIQNLLTDGDETQEYWLQLFVDHCKTLSELPVNGAMLKDDAAWPAFRQDYLDGLEAIRRSPEALDELTVLSLTRYRKAKLNAHALHDPFIDTKESQNRAAVAEYMAVVEETLSLPWPERLTSLAQGLFAGNLFDMGAKAAVEALEAGNFEFLAAKNRLKPRPWAVDDLDAWMNRIAAKPTSYRQALFFVDNAGADIILGALPLARSLADNGTRVVLAANETPALNDITAAALQTLLEELRQLDATLDAHIAADRIAVISSGGDAPLIDLANVSSVCCEEAARSDLLILEGMGRAIESNYHTQFTVDTIKTALTKDPMVARVIGVEMFDPIFRFDLAPNRND